VSIEDFNAPSKYKPKNKGSIEGWVSIEEDLCFFYHNINLVLNEHIHPQWLVSINLFPLKMLLY
jgi:hypothetical protein